MSPYSHAVISTKQDNFGQKLRSGFFFRNVVYECEIGCGKDISMDDIYFVAKLGPFVHYKEQNSFIETVVGKVYVKNKKTYYICMHVSDVEGCEFNMTTCTHMYCDMCYQAFPHFKPMFCDGDCRSFTEHRERCR